MDGGARSNVFEGMVEVADEEISGVVSIVTPGAMNEFWVVQGATSDCRCRFGRLNVFCLAVQSTLNGCTETDIANFKLLNYQAAAGGDNYFGHKGGFVERSRETIPN